MGPSPNPPLLEEANVPVYHITYAPEVREAYFYLDAGCPLRCWGCITDHYPTDCHLDEPGGAIRPPLKAYEALEAIDPYQVEKAFFLGKEPTVDPDLPILLSSLKGRGCHNVLITSGWEVVIEDVDEACISIKAVTPEVFHAFTGRRDPWRLLENFKRYVQSPVLVRAESVLVPGLVDGEEIEKIAQFIAGIDPDIPYRIDAYLPHPGDSFRAPTREELQRAKEIASRHLKTVTTLSSDTKQLWRVVRIY